MSAPTRPAPPYDPPPVDTEWTAIPDPQWRLVADKPCRQRSQRARRACRRPSVAELDRSYVVGRANWWAYCADHLYDRWVEDGQVMQWALRDVAQPGYAAGGRS